MSVPGRMSLPTSKWELEVRRAFFVETAIATMVYLPLDLIALPPTRPTNGQEGCIQHMSRPDGPLLGCTQ